MILCDILGNDGHVGLLILLIDFHVLIVLNIIMIAIVTMILTWMWERQILTPIILDSVGILVIVETKLDSNFATNQFLTDGLNPFYRYDHNRIGGGLLIYVIERIPVKALTDLKTLDDIECGI